jgi:major type 1 subunit fimbrin (pilin)
MKKTVLALSLLAAAGFSTSAFAEGTINFRGIVNSNTCAIDVDGSGSDVGTVTLAPATTADLNAEDKWAKRKDFTISLSGCTAGLTTARTYFEPGATTDLTTGNLITADYTNPGAPVAGADNVQLQLLNRDFSRIDLSQGTSAGQNSQPATITGGSAILNYWVQYIAVNGPAGPGRADSTVKFTMDLL